MIEANDSTIRTLGNRLDGQADYNSPDEQKKTPHKETPFSIKKWRDSDRCSYTSASKVLSIFDRPLLVPLACHGLNLQPV
jgi:hypothetical protein